MKSSTIKKSLPQEKDNKESVIYKNPIEKRKKKYNSSCKDEPKRKSVSYEESTSYQRSLSETRTYYSRQDSGVSTSSFSSCFSLIGLSLKVRIGYSNDLPYVIICSVVQQSPKDGNLI